MAQVFLTDSEWARVLTAARSTMHSGGSLVFETRDPARRAWDHWTRDETYREVEIPQVGPVGTWVEVTAVELPYVSFRHRFLFLADRTELTSDSTIRFRSRGEIADSLDAAGLELYEVRDAPDRPGLELIFIAKRQRGNDSPRRALSV